ncbi:MAG: bacterioferritin-associated ferredoxin [Bdellovibrionales bacterium]
MTDFSLRLKASDELILQISVDQNGTISAASLKGVGGPDMLKMLGEWRGRLKGKLSELALPTGVNGPELMLRELLLKARGEWVEPYQDEELCHCRSIPTAIVHQAILAGAHRPEEVSRWTSASTACGTCRKDVICLLKAQGLKVA